jgi:hypothetical protein
MRLQKKGYVDIHEHLKVDNTDDLIRRDRNIPQIYHIKIGVRRKRRVVKRK